MQRICRLCKGELQRKPVLQDYVNGKKIDPYFHFKIVSTANNIKVIVGEPDIKNSNSFKNIFEIVQTLVQRAHIDRYVDDDSICRRKWIFLENDGGILNPFLKLIFNTVRNARNQSMVLQISKPIYVWVQPI